ncbi:YhgE/Pip family protein [Priestia aryabhattai]|uniref:YhgE/Pip family protein n=1 Tax=Priestia megaterium TaxID=1404 RepID=UPI0039B89F94
MKNTVYIYTRDLKRIFTNWAMIIIVLTLMILPSFYAWFNIKASWDPYGRTEGIAIAVTSEDEGSTIRGQHVNVGKDIIATLKKNKTLGWTFVSKEKADHGVKHGDYYASIVIPKDFSQKLGTVLQDRVEKPVIIYKVNEKINAVAPKITSKGASSLTQQVSEKFVKTANGAIFSVFNELGITLQRDLPTIQQVEQRIFELENRLPEIKKVINEANDTTQKAGAIVSKAQAALPEVERLTADGAQMTQQLNIFLTKSEQVLKTAEPTINETLHRVQQRAIRVQELKKQLIEKDIAPAEASATAEQLKVQLTKQIADTGEIVTLLTDLNTLSQRNVLSPVVNDIKSVNTLLQQQLSDVNSLQQQAGDVPNQSALERFSSRTDQAVSKLNTLTNSYSSTIVPAVEQAIKEARNKTASANSLLNEANKSMPDVSNILSKTASGIVLGQQELAKIAKDFPRIEQNVHNIAEKIREFQRKENIEDIINLLKNDVQKESDFFAKPVLLKEERLYPIPNYGSAMSPFYTTLCLWVGALLLVSILSVEVSDEERFKSYEVYFGRLLTFLSIALVQAFIVTIGDLFLINTYVADKVPFIFLGLLCSFVFMTIVYTLVAIFGNAGKAMAIVLLVLQLSAAGGTFPIQVVPAFFQAINPFLPFTYAISMMREVVGGMLADIVRKDVTVLLGMWLGVLLIGVFLHKPLSKTSAKLTKKARESKLIH